MNTETNNNMISKLEMAMKTNHNRILAGRSGRAALAAFAVMTLCFGLMRTALADTLLFEGFEGSFPEDNGWTVGDSNASVTDAWWNDVRAFGTVGVFDGAWMGYCAGVGFAGTSASPLYQPDMDAYMRRTLDLRNYCSPALRFWYRTPSIETGYDRLVVSVGGELVFSNGTATAGWTMVDVDLSPWAGTQPTLNFTFHSDPSVQYEGVYLDNIVVTATPATATIYNVWWDNGQDNDGDGCLTAPNDTFRLKWDPDVSCSGGTVLSVFEKIYRRTCGSSTYTLYYTTSSHIITGNTGTDQQYLDIPASSGCTCYDYMIEIYRTGQTVRDFSLDMFSAHLGSLALGTHKEELLSQEKATIYNAWWGEQDLDGDGCRAATNDLFRLYWDADVVGGNGILTVFEKVYYRHCGDATWDLHYTTDNHTITNASGGDAVYVDIPAASSCRCYDYRIEVYRAGQTVPDYTMDSSNKTALANHGEERQSQDWPTVYIYPNSCRWGTQQDTDGDGCMAAPNDTFRLYWDADVTNRASFTLYVYEKIYSRPAGGSWTLYTTTASHLITNYSSDDTMYVDLPAHGSCSTYEYKIELYRLDHGAPDFVADASNFPVLGSHQEEFQSEEKATIYGAHWAYQQDHDGDGCWASTNNVFRLVWDSDVVGCNGTLTVFEKVYLQFCGSTTWNLWVTTANHAITGCAVDATYVDFSGSPSCTCFAYKIEVYRAGQSVPDFTLDPINYPSVLANNRQEVYSEDECLATINDAWWTYQADNDGDGCWEPLDANSSFRLNWNPNVVNCSGSISVFEKVYFRICGAANWSIWTTTASHLITGLSIADQQFINMPAGADCRCYEYKIEIYRVGQASPDYTRDPSNDADLANHQEEALTPITRPRLSIMQVSDKVVLSWPTSFTGFTLQSLAALPPGTWTTVTPAPVIVGNQYMVTNTIGSSPKFYHLFKP